MERYGFLRKSTADPDNIISVHDDLFTDIGSCVRAGSAQEQNLESTIYYFKILNNKEVVDYIHNNCEFLCVFSYFYLYRPSPHKPYSMSTSCDRLFSQLLECVLSAKCKPKEADDPIGHRLKVAYYKLFSDDELIKELHRR
ncbi:hypothetical protein JTE90_016087 [Oedothorax gibbosus]|uniref:Uncharacterized protein n=1 Tax=Oedothorax gibbosus TaxID=931172 RepID=A0AAV6TSK2_9ARAC|nr:hypothetical protein JTE90_016087 [Oedothorax gibbosus]